MAIGTQIPQNQTLFKRVQNDVGVCVEIDS